MRVNATILFGSIITDILDGIAHSKLVLADISVATTGKWAGQRNGNVMYEVGLAHAVRQSTEVLLIRSFTCFRVLFTFLFAHIRSGQDF